MSKRKKPLKRGDTVRVVWLDIHTDPVGDPTDADVELFDTVGKFVCWRKSKHGGKALITTDSTNPDGEPYGWSAYPKGCIKRVERVTK